MHAISVSLNPPEDKDVAIETFENAIERIEERNGLTGQPRIIIFHEKEGRRHAHAVWSRIDTETMTARNLSHYKLKLRDISRELYLENDWRMPRGLMNNRERDPRNFSLAEWQQAKRVGHNARDLKAMMQDCWAVSDNRAAFAHALQERGLILARGDRRGHVAVTHEGEVLSVARYVGKKTKEVTTKLGRPDDLPGVDEAKARQAKDMRAAFQRHVAEAKEQKRRALEPLEQRRKVMARKHREERRELTESQNERWQQENRQRYARLKSGIGGIWQRLSGEYAHIRRQNEQEAYTAFQRDRQQRETLIFAQMNERRTLQDRIKEVRQRHADLFRDIRYDRDRHGEAAQANPQARLREFRQAARTAHSLPAKEGSARTPAERLHSLRGQARVRKRDKGPEPER